MQRLVSIVIIFCLLGHAFVRTAWVLHYQWNKSAYMACCENKNKPQMKCAGQCHLKKKMAACEGKTSKDQQLPQQFREITDIQLFFENLHRFQFATIDLAAPLRLPPYQAFLPDPPRYAVFHPPTSLG